MDLYINLSGIVFRIQIPGSVTIENSFEKFLLKDTPAQWDAEIRFISGCQGRGPWPASRVYDDDYITFRTRNGETLFEIKGGAAGPVAYTVCSEDLSEMVCYMNTDAYPPLGSLLGLMQLIPLKWYLSRKQVLFLHSAEILLGNKGILFMAPSGTGKTTQSKLWQRYRQAEILCNDRVLMQGLKACGLPYDGSEPVCNPEAHEVHAIVCLGQAKENVIRRHRPSKAIARLMPMVLCDMWEPEVRRFVSEAMAQVVGAVPVYQLDCTPDEAAVVCLENQLRKDGVI